MNLYISIHQRFELLKLAESTDGPARWRDRARMVLAAADGSSHREIARTLGLSRHRIAVWCERFQKGGVAALCREQSRRKPAASSPSTSDVDESSPVGEPQLARFTDAGKHIATMFKVLSAFGVKPDPQTSHMEPILWHGHVLQSVAGLSIAPRESAVLLVSGQMPHDQPTDGPAEIPSRYERDPLIARVVEGLHTFDGVAPRSSGTVARAPLELLALLKFLHRRMPKDATLHAICESYVVAYHPKVQGWAKKHPRCRLHVLPNNIHWFTSIDVFFRSVVSDCESQRVWLDVRNLAHSVPNARAPRIPSEQAHFVWTSVRRIDD